MTFLLLRRYLVRKKYICLCCCLFYLLGHYSCGQGHKKSAQGSPVDNPIIEQARNLLNTNQYKRSMVFLDSAYSAFPDPDYYDLWLKYDFKAKYYLTYEKNAAKADLYVDSMLSVLKSREDDFKVAYVETIFSKGNVQMARNQYDQAFQSFYDGRAFAQKNLDSCHNSSFTSRFGYLLYAQKKYKEAIPYFKQALVENNYCKEDTGFENVLNFPQNTNNTIALCFEQSDQLDSAIYYYHKGLSEIDENSARFPERKKFAEMARGVIYGNLGGSYARKDDYKEAARYLNESIKINNRQGRYMEDAKTAQLKLAGLQIRFSKFKQADSLLNEIDLDLKMGRGTGEHIDELRRRHLKLKWEYFDKMGQVGQAYAYSQKYYAVRDSLDELKKGMINANLDEGLKDARQQYQLDLLNKNDHLKTVYLIAAGVFLLMFILIVLLLRGNLKRSRKNVRELVSLNKRIGEQNLQMQNALNALEQSQKENTHMMKIMAHDLRNPIGGITALADLMLEEQHHLEEDRNMLTMIKTSGQNSLDLINDLLQTTLQEDLKKERVDLFVLLNYCVSLLRFKAKEKRQQINLEAVHITLSLCREKMWRVLSNLIANAVKFSPAGTTISVKMVLEPNAVLVVVEDEGIGIPDDIKDKIFDMFTQSKRPGTDGEQPFGMGLAIAKQIVEAHQGQIWFEGRLQGGSTFFVRLPVDP